MLETPADERWERLLTKRRRGPCGLINQGPFLDGYGRKKIDRLAHRLGAFLGMPVWKNVGTAARDFW